MQLERFEVDVPGFYERFQERDSVLDRQVLDVRSEELEDDDPYLFVASATKLGHRAKPLLAIQFLRRDILDKLKELLDNQPFEFSKRLLLEIVAYLARLVRVAFAEDEIPNSCVQGSR